MTEEQATVAAAIKARVEAAQERQHGITHDPLDGRIVNELCVLAWDLAARFRKENKNFQRLEFILACGFKM